MTLAMNTSRVAGSWVPVQRSTSAKAMPAMPPVPPVPPVPSRVVSSGISRPMPAPSSALPASPSTAATGTLQA